MWLPCSPTGAQPLVFAPPQPFGAYSWKAYVSLGAGPWPMPGMHWIAAASTVLISRELHTTQRAVLQLFKQPGVTHSFGGSAASHLIPLTLLRVGEGSSLPGFVLPNDTVDSESVVRIKPCDSGVVIGYQVDKCTCTWLVGCFVVWLHFYPGFTGKV